MIYQKCEILGVPPPPPLETDSVNRLAQATEWRTSQKAVLVGLPSHLRRMAQESHVVYSLLSQEPPQTSGTAPSLTNAFFFSKHSKTVRLFSLLQSIQSTVSGLTILPTALQRPS